MIDRGLKTNETFYNFKIRATLSTKLVAVSHKDRGPDPLEGTRTVKKTVFPHCPMSLSLMDLCIRMRDMS